MGVVARWAMLITLASALLLSGCSRVARNAKGPSTTTIPASTSTTEPGPLAPLRPTNLVVGPNGNLYVADQSRDQILERRPDGTFTVVAGTGAAGFSGDGGPATDADLSIPGDITFSPAGDLYFADDGRVRFIDEKAVIHTVAGNSLPPSPVPSGTPALSASLAGPVSIAFNPQGVLYMTTSAHSGDVPSRLLRMTSHNTLDTVPAIVTTGPRAGDSLDSFGSIAFDNQGNLYATSLFSGWSVYKIDTAGNATLLGYARRSGGSTTDVERGPQGAIEVDSGPEILKVQGNGLVSEFNFDRAVGLNRFVFVDCFALGPDGTLYADNFAGAFDPYQQIVSVVEGRATSLWQGRPSR
jgi:sugar lactone lactonase YvrE